MTRLLNGFTGSGLRILLIGALVCIGMAGCSSTRSSQSGVSSTKIDLSKLDANVAGSTAYDIVQQFRPQWLQKRGDSSLNSEEEVSVYLDTNSTRFGPAQSLTRIQAVDIEAIEFLNSRRAQFKYGLDNTAGVILVHMKSGSS